MHPSLCLLGNGEGLVLKSPSFPLQCLSPKFLPKLCLKPQEYPSLKGSATLQGWECRRLELKLGKPKSELQKAQGEEQKHTTGELYPPGSAFSTCMSPHLPSLQSPHSAPPPSKQSHTCPGHSKPFTEEGNSKDKKLSINQRIQSTPSPFQLLAKKEAKSKLSSSPYWKWCAIKHL